ncbi:acid protease [Athelia psychrophila]|uniref:Acid protease n=1 Tax=Athelia psychrophila TaxID=1759441 RepID=A0A166DB68_9AGAM|nr:acid protease [Fibularhizoctonia sp. CBS 109695]
MLPITLSTLLLHLVTSNLVPQTLAVPNTQHGTGLRSLKLEARKTSRPSEAIAWSNTSTLITIEDDYDLDYVVNITIGGQVVALAVDTGSSDLWVHVQDRLETNSETDIDITLNYGIGSASGNVVYGVADLGKYAVPSQAFLDVNEVTDQNGPGILGLGLASLSSIYDNLSKERSAQPLMYNIFDQHPTLPKFIAISVERSNDKEEESGGSLSIGEYDPSFSAVAESPMIPVAHPQAARWTVAIDGMHINNKKYGLTSRVEGAAPGTSIALIDSGTSLAYIPGAAVDYIYENIPGSMRLPKNGQSSWAVPCMEPANLTFFLGGDSFAVHPLELTIFKTIVEDGQQWTICTNAFQAQLSVGATDLDFLLGDIFMRNVYSVFNYGGLTPKNQTQPPSIQLLSRTNQLLAYQEFAVQRAISLSSRPPLYDISKLNATKNDVVDWLDVDVDMIVD